MLSFQELYEQVSRSEQDSEEEEKFRVVYLDDNQSEVVSGYYSREEIVDNYLGESCYWNDRLCGVYSRDPVFEESYLIFHPDSPIYNDPISPQKFKQLIETFKKSQQISIAGFMEKLKKIEHTKNIIKNLDDDSNDLFGDVLRNL